MNVLFIIAAILFFLAAVSAPLIPNPTAWGLFFVALGLALGGVASVARVVTVGK